MDIVVENVAELTRKLTITLSRDQVSSSLNKAYSKLKNEVNLKGYRRGKVPRAVLERNFKEKVQAEVGEQLVQETYFDAIEKEKIDAVVHPEIMEHNFPEDGSFSYVAMVDVKPEFDLVGYKGLEIEKPSTEVTDEEIDKELVLLQKQHAVVRTADDGHLIELDDIAVVDFQGFHRGKAMKEVQNSDYTVDVGMHRLGEEFEGKLIGLKKGEKTLYEIDFPAEYGNPVLAGKTVEFKVDIKEVKVRVKPELDDEFAKDINPDHTSLDDLKSEIQQRLQGEKEKALVGDLDDRLMNRLLEENSFTVPARLINYEVQEMIKQTEEMLKRSGMTLETSGINLEEMVEQNKKVAEKRVRGDFILKKVAELEEIKLAEEDIQRGYQRIADQYNMTIDEVKGYFKRREELLPFMNELLNEKILAFLRDNASISEESVKEPAATPEPEEDGQGEAA
ncbi:MAG: trigger factor [Desulfobulbus propionicus]|nr:MAG: trigger factor [Desulfobulbus propionicus]